jgi:glyoxylate utilization-related uncharacterized protein
LGTVGLDAGYYSCLRMFRPLVRCAGGPGRFRCLHYNEINRYPDL